MEINEITLVESCQRGNLDDFGKLYDLYIKKIYNFIYYKTHHQETAEDLASQTFAKALEAIQKFKTKDGYFSAWLYQIARNTVIDYYRSKKVDYNLEDAWDMASETNIEQDLDAKQKLEEIKKKLKKFKSHERDIIIMRVWQEMSYAEIAEVVGKSEASCRMVFSRTIKQLRAEMPLSLLMLFYLMKF